MSLVFPRIGSEKEVDVYHHPSREPDESDDDFKRRVAWYEDRAQVSITVRLMPRETVRAWGFAFAKALAADAKRVRDLKAQGLDVATGITEEGIIEIAKLHRDVLSQCLVRVEGVVVGDRDLANVGVTEAIALLDDVDMLGAVAMAARSAQTPSPAQKN